MALSKRKFWNFKAVFFNKVSHKNLFNSSNHCSTNKCHNRDYKLNCWKKEIDLSSKSCLLHILYLSPFLFAFLVNWYSAGKCTSFLQYYHILTSLMGGCIISLLIKERLKKGWNGNAESIEKITPTNYGDQKNAIKFIQFIYWLQILKE